MKKLTLASVVAIAFGATACGTTSTNNAVASNNTRPSPTATAASTPVDELAVGRALYSQNCAACHKEDGTGGKKTIEGKTLDVEDLTAEKIKKFTDEKIAGYISNGVEDEGMPAFKDKLSEAQIREVVAFVRRDIQKIDAASR